MDLLKLSVCAAAVAAATFAGCSLYNKRYETANLAPPPYDLKIVQIDDFGSFWDATRANQTLEEIKQATQEGNVLVVLFIHGWHHNAADDDENLLDFNKTLQALSNVINTPVRQALREQLTGSKELRLIGVYMGWRGRSLPGFLDYATMWWRKSAAERVGDGDASEFIERLDRIYLRRNTSPPDSGPAEPKPTMGLVTIGHSFGGQVLLRAIARSFEYSLAERAPCFANVLKPVSDPRAAVAEHTPVDSLGDLNILVNPATEAYQFARIDALYRQLAYPETQTPQVVVFSADNDVPRKSFFPIARVLTRPFRPGFRPDDDNYQGALWGKALGELPQQQTHDLSLVQRPDSLTDADYAGPNPGAKIEAFDFTGAEVVFKGVGLTPVQQHVPGGPNFTPFSPVVVAVTHQDIIDGHTGIFGETFRNFLVDYVAYVEGKRALLKFRKHVQLRSGMPAAGQPPAVQSVSAAVQVCP
ncbi:hypothetical protein AB3X91_41100 [Paraburkholderia sp. BR14263]|uniref:hypothetical protein n=1 Tax=unclassified Paraburkholderia TaxID=2615204 RepID=UPI0034CFC60E